MAACLVAAVGTVSLSALHKDQVLVTAKGEFRKVPLQDKSIATINSGSQIEVEFTKRQRTVNLRKGEAWFEGPGYPVLATASATEDTAFVRVLLLPQEWAGKRTIRYLDPADEAKPKLQRATVLLEQPLEP